MGCLVVAEHEALPKDSRRCPLECLTTEERPLPSDELEEFIVKQTTRHP